MSAFGGRADLNHGMAGGPLLAISGHNGLPVQVASIQHLVSTHRGMAGERRADWPSLPEPFEIARLSRFLFGVSGEYIGSTVSGGERVIEGRGASCKGPASAK